MNTLKKCEYVKVTEDILTNESCIYGTFENTILDCNFHIIYGNSIVDYGVGIKDSNNFTVKNCIVEGFGIGIYIVNSSKTVLLKNNLSNNFWSGVSVEGSHTTVISQNTICKNSWYGLKVQSSYNTTISENNFFENNISIYFDVSDKKECINDVKNNLGNHDLPIYYTNRRAKISGSYAEVILCNADESVLHNVRARGSGIFAIFTDNTQFISVNSSKNIYGIFLLNSNNNTMKNCTFNRNVYGIYLQNSSNNKVEDCTIYNNSKFDVYGDASGESICKNVEHTNISCLP